MLDPRGFVATCNSTNFFIVRRGEILAPRAGHLMEGITRRKVISLAQGLGLRCTLCEFGLSEVYAADEAFVTGTFGGVVHVDEVDGRRIRGRDWEGGQETPAQKGQVYMSAPDLASAPQAGEAPRSAAADEGPITRRLMDAYRALCDAEAGKGREAASS